MSGGPASESTHPPGRPPGKGSARTRLPTYAATAEDAAAIRAHIDRMVAGWPPLSTGLRERLRPLLALPTHQPA